MLFRSSAMILYLFFENQIVGKTYTAATFIVFVIQMLVVSPLIGFTFGYASYRVSRVLHYYGEANIDLVVIISIVCGYGSFFVAEKIFGISGVLSCFSAGLSYAHIQPLLFYILSLRFVLLRVRVSIDPRERKDA